MRFNTEAAPPSADVSAGDIFAARGPGPARYWLVMSVRGETGYCAGLDEAGRIVTTASYGLHALRDRDLMGRCHGLAELTLDVEWRTPR